MDNKIQATIKNGTANESTDNPSTSAAMAKTTTISTIAVQSGKTRIVIALLHCGDWINLKILEITPELTTLGATLAEAVALQQAHDEVLRQLQNKQSPVEELLRQADQLIATQRPRAEVYAAMAESLGKAWKDINSLLELRKQILDLNVQYHSRAQEFFDKMDALEASCSDTVVPIEIEAVKQFLTTIHELRRALLESLMGALQAGNSLLGKLKELGAEGTLDSRPDRIRTSVNRAISQVQGWLDELHMKRQILEATFNRRKTQLEQCLALAILAADLRELENIVHDRRDLLTNTDQLGDSSSSAELLLHEHKKLLPEAKQLQEKALKITKATEQLVASGCFAGEQATEQSYIVLSETSDYLSDLQKRDLLLERVIAFFRSAQTVLDKLNHLEIQLTTTELPSTSPQLAQLHAQCSKAIDEATAVPIAEGYSILDSTGRGRHGTEGVKRMVEELENKKISLDGLCTAHKEENIRINTALNNFLEKHNELYTWLVNIAEAFLQGHQDMGSDLPMAKDFLDLHKRLLDDLQIKGTEINALLLTLPPLLEYLEDNQRRDVDVKVEELHERWMNLKGVLENRLDLTRIYVKFHMEADIVNKEMDNLESLLLQNRDNITDETMRNLEEKWESLLPLYQSAKNTGLTFIDQSKKVSEPYLDTKRACVCVESVLERLSGRQLVVTRNWQTFHTEVVEKRELLVHLEQTMAESIKTINWVTKLDTQLYPVITTNRTNPKDIVAHLENKLETILPDIKRAHTEVEQRIKSAETLISKTQSTDEKTLNVKNKLFELNQKLIEIASEYQVLLQVLISYFNNLAELEKTAEDVNARFAKTGYPNDISEVESLIREHETSRQTVLERFKFAQNECEQVTQRINRQEPPQAAEQDIEKLHHPLELIRDRWEQQCHQRSNSIDAHRQLCQFDTDLHQINETLDDLGHQLEGVKGKYGESLAAAKATSHAFVYFEKTVELLEQRIGAFVTTGEKLLAESHDQSPHIQQQLRQLKERWNDFKKQVQDTRHLIDLSIQYFQIVDEADEWFKEGNRLLSTIARKSTLVKRPEEAQELLNEISTFLKPNEEKQNQRIAEISKLAVQIFGPDISKHATVISGNKEMLESFSSISNELNILSQNLKAAEEERLRIQREQEEANRRMEIAKAEAEKARKEAEEKRKAMEALRREKLEITILTQVHQAELQRDVTPLTPELVLEQGEILDAPTFTSPLSDAVIQEGSKFTFICQVTGIPLPVVTWCKDGISIQNNPDYQTTFDQGLCTLTIEETFAEDSAKYTCKATNAAGTAETTALLSVKETEPEEQLIAPSFIKLLEPGSAREGSTFQFECKVTGNPLPTVQWFKNHDCIDNSPDYVFTYNNGDAIMKFEKIHLEDKAEYTCKASNQMGVAQSTASLGVIPLEPTETPAFIVPLSNVMARAGQKIKLECEVSGLPIPILTWSHNGKAVKETREQKLQFEGNKATLLIFEAFPKDAGTYQVSAKNIAGEASSSCSVSVKGRLPTETSDSELASDMEPVKPSIQLPLTNLSVDEGNRVRLDCIIVGQPEPEVIWYHDERPVKESPDFQLLFQGDRCSLVIQEALPEDAGEYKVVALNSAGEASSKCILSVTPATAQSDTASKPQEEKVEPTGSLPKFSKLLADVLVSEGDKVILEGNVTGQPKPEIKWLLNNLPITDRDHVKITDDEEGNVKLEIENVKPEDKGVYTVKAINSLGEAKCFAQLIVKSFKPPETVKHEEVKSEPVFKELFNDRIAFENTATKFECIVVGKPTPKVKWLFNGEPISGKNFLISTSGDRQVLSIPDIAKDHQGTITCVAENEVGKASCAATLTVQSSDSITLPEKPLTELEQHVETSYLVNREVISQSTTTSSKTISSQELNAAPTQVQHSYVSHDEQSYKQVNQQAPEIRETHKIEEFHKIGNEAPVIHEKSSTVYSTGESSIKSESQIKTVGQEIVHKPAIKMRPPRFVTPVMGKIIDQDVDVVLEGILDGQPTPEVKWTKNGEELKNTDRLTIKWELNRASVEIRKSTVDDAGRYTCTAINEAGKAVSTADLVIRKTVFPPVFGRRLQAQVIKKGDRVNMEVEVTGTPEPVVTWFKDGVPIDEALKQNYKIKSIGNTHTLVIERAELSHNGRFMVRAVNSGGEAQSIADIAVFEPTPDTMVEVVKTVVFEDVRKHETLTSAADKTSSVITTPKLIPIEPPKVEAKPTVSSFSSSSQTSQSVSSKSEFSSITQQKMSEHKVIKLEHTVPDIPLPKPIHTKKEVEVPVMQLQTDFEICHPPEIIQEQQIESQESGIETSSISKQSSLQYFVKKMKGDEQQIVEKEIAAPEPIKPEIYKKFEATSQETQQRKEVPIPISIEPPKPAPKPIIKPPTVEPLPTYQAPIIKPPIVEPLPTYQVPIVKQYESYSSTKQVQEEFDLKPEPPPQICYSSQVESIKQKEDIIEPQRTWLPAKSEHFEEKKSFSEKIESSYQSSSYSHEINKSTTPIQKPWTPKPEIQRPASVASSYSTTEYQKSARPLSAQSGLIEPSPQGIAMEKTWAHKFSETQVEKSWPPPQTEEPKIQPSWSVHSTLDKKWTPGIKSESISKESKTIIEQIPQVPHYIAQVSHSSCVSEQKTSQSSFEKTIHYESGKTEMHKEHIIEDRNVKPSEIIKSWPPAPPLQEYVPPPKPISSLDSLHIRPVSVQDITDEVYLEPGPPPEIGYAQPPRERKQSYVEMIEQDLEKNLEREPKKVLPCAVRTIPPPKEAVPPPLPPKNEFIQAPPIPAKQFKVAEPPKKIVEIISTPFERFPDLEPFPFKPDPQKPKPPKVGPPPTPSKFIKGRFVDSDYESDFEAVRILPKWRPSSSDTEDLYFRSVRAPKPVAPMRSRSTEREPLPPSKFDQPPQFQGPPRPEIDFELCRRKKDTAQIKKMTKELTKTHEIRREISPPKIKPGSPPVFVEPEKKPEVKQKMVIDGYMADTDEPIIQQQKKFTKTEYKHEEKTEYRQMSQSSEKTFESFQKTVAPKPRICKYPVKKHHTSVSSSKKELVATPIITSVTTHQETQQSDQHIKLEPFPFKPEPPKQKKPKGPPPPSPSKFVKGEFRESDYESDYEGKIQPVWRPAESTPEPAYKPVKPILTPTSHPLQHAERSKTPPTRFDRLPHVDASPKPKFEPIEKFMPQQKIIPAAKPVIFKPKPLPATYGTELVVAKPDIPTPIYIQPGSPPEIAYAAGPTRTQYYRSTTSAPYHNAIQTETSNIMHFNESTENCKRHVSMQQTTKVIKFGDQTRKQETKLEPFPYHPEPERPRRSGVPPPPTPSKFVPGGFRESDYESEVESARIKPKWTPGGSDSEDLHYRRVRAPASVRSSSVPAPRDRVVTPMEFDTQPPQMPSTIDVTDSESRRTQSTMYKRFTENRSGQVVRRSHSYEPPKKEIVIHPGTPPEYGYVPEQRLTRTTATKIASEHMDSMTQAFKSKTQKFVKDIMNDVSSKQQVPQKRILKTQTDGDAQVYREESRAAQYGTKHVDPDTGLIYFKYDFGYEFGIILPGESKKGEIPVPKKTVIEPPKRTTDIEMPVHHETTKGFQNTNHAPTPQFKPKKFTSSGRVKWEPTSESEMSEYEGEANRRNLVPGSRWEPSSCSPVSLSPSLPSTSPAFNNTFAGKRAETPPSCPSTPGSTHKVVNCGQIRAPMFITPLRDIAVVSGQTAKFECIVQSEPPPNILWSKDGRILQNTNDHQIHYRNGVCRLTITQAYPEDAGTYSCTATNPAGTTNTLATLQVPGERRSSYIK